jgi:hypothetical protein
MPNTTTPRKFLRQTGTGTPKRSLSVKEYEFTDGQLARSRTAIETWGHYGATAGRVA